MTRLWTKFKHWTPCSYISTSCLIDVVVTMHVDRQWKIPYELKVRCLCVALDFFGEVKLKGNLSYKH